MLAQELYLRLEPGRFRNIVRILNCDVPTLREQAGRDFGFDIAARGYLTQPNPAVLGSIARSDDLGPVGRAEVDDDKFEVPKGLVEYAFDRLGYISLDIANDHHDGNKRLTSCWHAISSQTAGDVPGLVLNGSSTANAKRRAGRS